MYCINNYCFYIPPHLRQLWPEELCCQVGRTYHFCKRCISKTHWGHFFKFWSSAHYDSIMNWLDFGYQHQGHCQLITPHSCEHDISEMQGISSNLVQVSTRNVTNNHDTQNWNINIMFSVSFEMTRNLWSPWHHKTYFWLQLLSYHIYDNKCTQMSTRVKLESY